MASPHRPGGSCIRNGGTSNDNPRTIPRVRTLIGANLVFAWITPRIRKQKR
jgi:hypothetical protein